MSKPHCTATTSREQTPLVRARNVHKYFGDNHVLRGIDLDVNSGETVVILGPSVSGKSTFLRCINHLETMDEGYIMMGDEQIGYQLRGEKLYPLSARVLPANVVTSAWCSNSSTSIPYDRVAEHH